MKLYRNSSGNGTNKSDKVFMIGFIIIFALCFLPFALKKVSPETENVLHITDESNNISGPSRPDDIITVAEKPGIEFNYAGNLPDLTDEMLQSEAALVYDTDSNTILYSKNADKALFPASTTKILTACVALRHLPPDYQITVGSELELIQPDSSLAYLKTGNVLTLEDALYALLLPSGNDAAYVIAVNTARCVSKDSTMSDKDAVKYFCNLMNDEAVLAGADRTHFCVPDGYHDPFHYTTAKDLLRIAIIAREFPLISEIVKTPFHETKIISGESYYWTNGNLLVTGDTGYYLPFATGLKTGFTDEAGYCMVATASQNEKNLIAVTMNSPTLAGRYTDAAKLFYAVLDPAKLTEPAETNTLSEETIPNEKEPTEN